MSDKSSGQRWVPLEANPDVMNKLVGKMGLRPTWQFTDVFGLDPELLAMLPQPVCALLLLFPISEKYKSYMKDEVARLEHDGQHVSSNVFFMKQTIGNACGTIGLLHAITNNAKCLDLDDGYLTSFMEATKSMNSDERGKYLESDERISTLHAESAQEGQSTVPSSNESKLHFVSLVQCENHLYELDGRKPCPINHGATTSESFLQDAAKVCQQFMARDPTEMHFTVIALAKM